MSSAPPTVRQGIDPAWLARAAERDPVSHAYAVWDLANASERTRFVSFGETSETRSYLLIWYGEPHAPVVHWVGEAPGDLVLLDSLPTSAVVAVVPESIAPELLRRRPLARSEPLLILARTPAPVESGTTTDGVRRLNAIDTQELHRFLDAHPDPLTRGYRPLDLARETVWGAFEDRQLVGVTRSPVRLPKVWIVGGVFVAPSARRRGHGRRLLGFASSTASDAGATPALFVREKNADALRLYESLGYRRLGRRAWVDLAPRPS